MRKQENALTEAITSPIGFAFELAPDSSFDRTPPQAIRSDYW
ncbi:MAG: hypothetical protein O7E52_19770 [Candidatus Poribacteria bacterium]|nr:hypothetical protein [Candidatus Poribacteria bacterium]